MLLNLYGKDGIIYRTLVKGFKEAHMQDRLKFEVVEADKVGQKFKDAVKDAYNAKFLDDADIVIRFAIPKNEQPEEEQPETEEKPEGEETKQAEQPEGDSSEKSGKEEVAEAETTLDTADLKKKIISTVERCLYPLGDEKVELSDLEGFLDGYDVSFVKVSLKDRDSTEA